LAAQLPELLRGVFYDGWNPSHDTEVARTASLVARVARRRLSGGALEEALDTLPADIRQLAA